MAEYLRLLALSDDELRRADVVEMNLLVAKSIPSLADLDIPRYQRLADEWAEAIRARLPKAERMFQQSPQNWKNDVNFFRLGVMHQFVECELGIEYIDAQREIKQMLYTNPSDLFLHGVMDTRRGTCGNMAALHVALGRRLGWPVSLACVGSHFILRYDDGKVTHNLEATQSGFGGFKSDPDDYLIRHDNLPSIAVTSGSDLHAMTPREMLGAFISLRGRHMHDSGQIREAQLDYLLARWLYPNNRRIYRDLMALIVPDGARLFEPWEIGSPEDLAKVLAEQCGISARSSSIPLQVMSTTIRGVIHEPIQFQ